MSIRDFHSRMKPDAARDALFEALRLLKEVEDPAILHEQLAPWDLWPID